MLTLKRTKQTRSFLSDAFENGERLDRGNDLPVSHVLSGSSVHKMVAVSVDPTDYFGNMDAYLILGSETYTVKNFLRKSKTFVKVTLMDDDGDTYEVTLPYEAARNMYVECSWAPFGK